VLAAYWLARFFRCHPDSFLRCKPVELLRHLEGAHMVLKAEKRK